MLTAFSYKNGPGWNHFTKREIIALFSNGFELAAIRHYRSLEGRCSCSIFLYGSYEEKALV
jgi:hypothetical protein